MPSSFRTRLVPCEIAADVKKAMSRLQPCRPHHQPGNDAALDVQRVWWHVDQIRRVHDVRVRYQGVAD